MADETTVTSTTEATAAEQTETTETEPEATGETPEQLRAELAKAREALKATNRESAERRKRLEALEAADKKRKTAELSEVEQLKQEAADAKALVAAQQQKMQAQALKHTVERQAATLGFINPEDAQRLAELANVAFNEEGQPDGKAIETALKALAKTRPYLMKGAAQATGDINGADGRGQVPANSAAKDEELKRRFNIRRS